MNETPVCSTCGHKVFLHSPTRCMYPRCECTTLTAATTEDLMVVLPKPSLQVEINEAKGEPTICKVWVDGRLKFFGSTLGVETLIATLPQNDEVDRWLEEWMGK